MASTFETLSTEDQIVVSWAAKKAQTKLAEEHPQIAKAALSETTLPVIQEDLAKNGNIATLREWFKREQSRS